MHQTGWRWSLQAEQLTGDSVGPGSQGRVLGKSVQDPPGHRQGVGPKSCEGPLPASFPS